MDRRLVTFTLPFLIVAALVAPAIPAGAGRTDAEQAFCDEYQQGPANPDDTGGGYYRSLAKVAPKKSIKKALKNIGKYFDKLEDIDPNDQGEINDFITGKDYAKYVKSTGKFTAYVTKTCGSTPE